MDKDGNTIDSHIICVVDWSDPLPPPPTGKPITFLTTLYAQWNVSLEQRITNSGVSVNRALTFRQALSLLSFRLLSSNITKLFMIERLQTS